ncbi:MAG: hypothetical protein ACRDBX_05340 [Erysipelotrichaceae bacterium]
MKKIAMLVSIVSCLFIFFIDTKANNNVNSYENSVVCPFNLNYSWYEPISKVTNIKIDATEIVKNNTTQVTTTTVTRSRAKFTSMSTGVHADISMITGSVGASIEVGVGSNTMVSVTLQAQQQPGSTLTFSFGSRTMNTSGRIYSYDAQCNLSSRASAAYYSYAGYSVYN